MLNRDAVSQPGKSGIINGDDPAEQWRDIPSFPNYQASTLGRVRSLPRTLLRNGYEVRVNGGILKCSASHGYARAILRINGKTVYIEAHILIALAFIGPRPKGHDVRHLDGNPSNNIPANLCYGSRAQNIADGIEHDRYPRDGKPGVKLTRAIVRSIYSSRSPAAPIAEKYGVRRDAIYAIRAGRAWRRATRDLPIIDRRKRRAE